MNVETTPETKTVYKRAYGKRADETATMTTFTLRMSRDVTAYANTLRNLAQIATVHWLAKHERPYPEAQKT
ncbi:MAG: hypothetical protein QX198_06705 [Methylococcaceae bacterium]